MNNQIFDQKEVLNAILRQDFKSFAVKVFNELNSGTAYLDNWHVDLIASRIADMREGVFGRLIVNIPPRYMKSILCSVALPAFLLGHAPEARIICVSYGDDLALKLANDCRSIMQTSWYRELFSGTRLSAVRHAVHNFETTAGGGRFATSTGGTLTGIGAEWIIIDDPLKPLDAMSDSQREKVNEWYRSTLYSRLNNKVTGKILLVMQRLHESDLTGFLLESDPSYRHIKLPVVAEEDEKWLLTPESVVPDYIERKPGDLLHSERENQDAVDAIQASLGSYAFAGQYQQSPMPMGGGLVKKEWLHYYPEPKTRGFVRLIQSWDTAAQTGTNNAYSACVLIGVDGNGIAHVLDCFRERLDFPSLTRRAVELYNRDYTTYHRHPEIVIEEASSGLFLKQILESAHGLRPIGFRPEAAKEVRLMGITPDIQSGKVRFPGYNPVWWPDFAHELLTFPAAKFKDQCDALSQGIHHIRTTATIGQPMVAPRPGTTVTSVRANMEKFANDPKNYRGPMPTARGPSLSNLRSGLSAALAAQRKK